MRCLGRISFSDLSAHVSCCAGRDGLEQWLVLGASRWEATQGIIQRATTAALAPTLSHLSIMGLVTLPNAMAGQLLGGSVPIQV